MKPSAISRLGAISLMLVVAIALPGVVEAQGFQLAPSVTLLASYSNNPLRLAGNSLTSNFVSAQADFPFRFRGPRWTGGFNLQPTYQKYQDDSRLDNLQAAGQFDITGRLSSRTRLRIVGDAMRSEDLGGQLGADIVVGRSRQVRAQAEATLSHDFSLRDTISLNAQYERREFQGSPLVGNEGVGAGLSFGHRLSNRLSLTMSGLGQTVSFDTGSRARSLSATAGFLYRLGARTEVGAEAGALYVQQDIGSRFVTVDGAPGVAARVTLAHAGESMLFAFTAVRDMGFSNGLGQSTIRNQVRASLGTAGVQWNLQAVASFARNELLGNAAVLGGDSIDTWTGCVGGSVRVTHFVSAVGSFLLAHQVGSSVNPDLDIEAYRAAVGLMFQARQRSDASRAGRSLEDARLTRNIHVTC